VICEPFQRLTFEFYPLLASRWLAFSSQLKLWSPAQQNDLRSWSYSHREQDRVCHSSESELCVYLFNLSMCHLCIITSPGIRPGKCSCMFIVPMYLGRSWKIGCRVMELVILGKIGYSGLTRVSLKPPTSQAAVRVLLHLMKDFGGAVTFTLRLG